MVHCFSVCDVERRVVLDTLAAKAQIRTDDAGWEPVLARSLNGTAVNFKSPAGRTACTAWPGR